MSKSPKCHTQIMRRNRPDKIVHDGQFIWMQAIPGLSRALSAVTIWATKIIRSGRDAILGHDDHCDVDV